MANISLNCPNCGADLDVVPGQATTECPYCKSDIFIGPLADHAKMSAMQRELRAKNGIAEQAGRMKEYHRALKKWKGGFGFFLSIIFVLNALAFALVGGSNDEDETAIGVGSMIIIIIVLMCFMIPAFFAAAYPCYDVEQDKVTRTGTKRWSAFFILLGIEAAVLVISLIAAFFLMEYVL